MRGRHRGLRGPQGRRRHRILHAGRTGQGTIERSKRLHRFEREVLENMSEFLLHGLKQELPAFTSVSAVEVSSDLRSAKAFFRLVGDEKQADATKDVLERARPAFQRQIARDLKTKFCPVLRFEFGVAPHRDEIDTLLENLRRPHHYTD